MSKAATKRHKAKRPAQNGLLRMPQQPTVITNTVPELRTNQTFVDAMQAHQQGKHAEAERGYREVLKLDPGNPDALHGIGLLAIQSGHADLARKLIRRAVQIAPNAAPFRNNLAIAHKMLGNVDAAIAEYRRCLDMDPEYHTSRANLIFSLDFHPDIPPEMGFFERRRYGAGLQRYAKMPPYKVTRDPDRKLRVGYVSADFRHHSAAHVHGVVIANHDHEQIDVVMYSSVVVQDVATEAFRHFGTLKDVAQLDDLQLATMIREDEIDILVDLSGHSEHNRLGVFAFKPAPVQITAWGYAMGTGVPEIDYFFGDDVVTPEGAEDLFVEKIIRLPSMMVYDPGTCPDIAEPPYKKNGYVTFGYLGRPYKLNNQSASVWAEILRQVPDSRLYLKHGMYSEISMRETVCDALITRGVAEERIIVEGNSSRYDHLAAYNKVDITLDSLPQCGGMTTLDATWMGTPTITHPDRTVCERTSAGILTTALGAEQAQAFIAESLNDYVSKAVALATVFPEHGTLESRQEFRDLMADSMLMAHEPYTREIERIYRALWRRWLDESAEPAEVSA